MIHTRRGLFLDRQLKVQCDLEMFTVFTLIDPIFLSSTLCPQKSIASWNFKRHKKMKKMRFTKPQFVGGEHSPSFIDINEKMKMWKKLFFSSHRLYTHAHIYRTTPTTHESLFIFERKKNSTHFYFPSKTFFSRFFLLFHFRKWTKMCVRKLAESFEFFPWFITCWFWFFSRIFVVTTMISSKSPGKSPSNP